MKYIDAEKMIAEIERLHKEHCGKYECDEAALVLEELEDFIETLEVKEVDDELPRPKECYPICKEWVTCPYFSENAPVCDE